MCAAVNWNNDDRVQWTMKGGVVRKKQGVSRTKVSETTMFLSEKVVGPRRFLVKIAGALCQVQHGEPKKERLHKVWSFFFWLSMSRLICFNTVNSLVSYRLSICEVGSLRGARFRGKMKSTPQNAGANACLHYRAQALLLQGVAQTYFIYHGNR